ncbi:hypothetical protein niasHS_007536 [Heterodera schachtii]|uniref:Attractin n=1 Tax=Heterodera schachtii TaxID=97005 RepID=A0ABD2JXS1_HETSC
MDGTCRCPHGWGGPQCENCVGRVRRVVSSSQPNGSISDGPNNYGASARCIWVVENEETKDGALLFKLDDFFAECCWDMLYIYDGRGVYGDLLGVFSGSLSGREILANSGEAIVYFASDLAFNLPGFNITYAGGQCLQNCSGNGICVSGRCICNDSFWGDACQHQLCLSTMDNQTGPCKNRALCKDKQCGCTKHHHGQHCQELVLNPVWDFVLTENVAKHFPPRASHKSVAVGRDEVWLHGGFMFNPARMNSDFVVFNVRERRFRAVKSKGTEPTPRYDHSVVLHKKKLYVFGGVINQKKTTNEFWEFDMVTNRWNLLSSLNASTLDLPMALAGHSAHVIGNEMHILFGYNPFEGYMFTPQIYSFETGRWRWGAVDPSVQGRFGHASAQFAEFNGEEMVLIHGGYNAPINSYSYSISDELLLYEPKRQIWNNLGSFGAPLFRHSAVILDGIMLLVGGNSHNESSTTRKKDCYSEQIYAYDTICKRPVKIYSKEFEAIARYGHSAFVSGGNMFIVGGFNGEMLNDVLLFTPANCDSQATNAEECSRLSNGVRCVFHNKSCTKTLPNSSFRQSFLSIAKGETAMVSYQEHCTGTAMGDKDAIELRTCTLLTDCNNCLLQKGCGWCESSQSCLGSYANCADGLLGDRSLCPFGGAKQRRTDVVVQRPCSLATNCFSCNRLPHCTWFAIDTKHICVSLADEAILIEEHNRMQTERLSLTPMADDASSTNVQQQSNPSSTLSPQSIISNVPSSIIVQDVIIVPSSSQHKQQNATCPLPCFMKSSCQSCIDSQCMWCPSNQRCVSMDTYMVSFPYGQCQSWVTAANTHKACQTNPFACELQKTCSDCQSIGPRCGWCDDGSGTGLGKCVEGTNSGALDPNQCPADRWYFTGEPECQCNGHSNCTENVTYRRLRCTKCQHRTRGEHCELCEPGFFGDPRNGGTCQECQCNGQAALCNPLNGDCFCSTKGVIGPRCDKCEPKYFGDPKNGGTCTYELAIDFIFTFKLDSNDIRDKYVNQINFFSVPYKRDTDVQFSITCEGDTGAKVTINLTTQLLEGRPPHTKHLMAGQLCTASGIKRTYSSTDPGFAFGTETNTTFHVRVNDFETPIKIQISFAQSLPINWILFFVIFAACFIVLLVVAGLIWIIKMRIEWYRNIRRRHDEIEEMASRPFSSVQLDLGHCRAYTVEPCAVEPCANYQAGVYTVIVRLPTGGQPFTPYGTSGIALASSLCQLTPAQLALLQPPDLAKQRNRKSNFKKFMPFIRS